MDRDEILSLYRWERGICFRHPAKGIIETAVVGVVHPREEGERQIRACADCVVALEAIRRDAAAEAGTEYEPGYTGDALK